MIVGGNVGFVYAYGGTIVVNGSIYEATAEDGGKVYIAKDISGNIQIGTYPNEMKFTAGNPVKKNVQLPAPNDGFYWDEWNDEARNPNTPSYVYKRQGSLYGELTGNQAFDNLTKDNFIDYDTPLPTGGRTISEEELLQILSDIWDNAETNYDYYANTSHSAYLLIEKNSGGSVTNVEKNQSWDRWAAYTYYASRSEKVMLTGSDADKTFVELSKQDDSYWYNYNWIKGSNTGTLTIYEKSYYYNYQQNIEPLRADCAYDKYMVLYDDDYYSVNILYDEQIFLGETCMVYSQLYSDGLYTSHYYDWVSKDSGRTLKRIYISPENTDIYVFFLNRQIDMPASFFDVPADVVFTTYVYESPVKAFVTRLYKNVLEREPDPNGVNTWVERLLYGEYTGSEIAYGFYFSVEFLTKPVSNEEYVYNLYSTMMDRDAAYDDYGRETWIERLENGMSRDKVLEGFLESPEFAERCAIAGIEVGDRKPQQDEALRAFVWRLYNLVLGRHADAEGINAWTGRLNSGEMTGSEVAHQFFFDTVFGEYASRNRTTEQYVDDLYWSVMGRSAQEDPGRAVQLERLTTGGWTRAMLFDDFAVSAEFAEICEGYGILA